MPVLIVGAGPTGLTAALLLARFGVACMLVDRQAEAHPMPRAVHVDDEVVRILQRLGLAADFAAISRPAAGLRLVDARLRPFAEFRRDREPGRHGHPEANLFDQPDLERLLLDRVRDHPDVVLRRGMEVTAVAQLADGMARVRLRGLDGAVEHVLARFVLGCDGAASTVRDAIGSRLRDLRFTERWLVLDARCRPPVPNWGGVDQICDPRRPATFMALPGDRYRWEFRMHPAEDAADLTDPARIAELVAPWHVGELEVLRAAAYTFRARVADRWRAGPVLLLGDAAHQTPPFIGQGLGAGLRDAHGLAWKLAAVLAERAPGAPDGGPDGSPDEDAVLDSHQAERGPDVEAVIRGAVRVGRAMTGGQDVAAALRRPAVKLLLQVPGVRAAAMRDLTTRYPAGALVDRPRHRRDLTGTLCPQPVVVGADGRRVRLDDALGDGYALLTTGSVPQALRVRAHRLGARTLRISGTDPAAPPADVRAASDAGRVCDVDGVLQAWLRGGRAGAVLLRPDRIVRATAPMCPS